MKGFAIGTAYRCATRRHRFRARHQRPGSHAAVPRRASENLDGWIDSNGARQLGGQHDPLSAQCGCKTPSTKSDDAAVDGGRDGSGAMCIPERRTPGERMFALSSSFAS